MQMQQSCSKTIDIGFNHNNAFTVWTTTKYFQQMTSKANKPTGINTCNNRDYDLTEVLNSQWQCTP